MHHASHIVGLLALMLATVKAVGWLAKRAGHPAVLGELVADVFLGLSVAGLVSPKDAVTGKFLAGFAPFWFRGDRKVVGVGMIPPGEVGGIVAPKGLAASVFDAGPFRRAAGINVPLYSGEGSGVRGFVLPQGLPLTSNPSPPSTGERGEDFLPLALARSR